MSGTMVAEGERTVERQLPLRTQVAKLLFERFAHADLLDWASTTADGPYFEAADDVLATLPDGLTEPERRVLALLVEKRELEARVEQISDELFLVVESIKTDKAKR